MIKSAVLLAVLMTFAGAAWPAASVFGTWRLATSTQVKATVLDKALGFPGAKNPVVKGVEFATFNGDFSYSGTDWINRVQIYLQDGATAYLRFFDIRGQWKYKAPGRYVVDFDRFVLDFSDRNGVKFNAPFLLRSSAEAVLQKSLGYLPTLTGTLLVTSTDNGTLKNGGKAVQGTKKTQFYAFWNDPVEASKQLQALVDVTVKYTGKPYKVTSQCCKPKSSDAEENAANAAQNLADSADFLAATEQESGIGRTASGLLVLPLQEGSGDPPAATDQVIVNYRGFFPNGLIFDAGTLANFGVNQVIAGWTEGLQLMRPGSKYRFYIPSELAYKEAGSGSIGPNAALVFDVELVRVIKPSP